MSADIEDEFGLPLPVGSLLLLSSLCSLGLTYCSRTSSGLLACSAGAVAPLSSFLVTGQGPLEHVFLLFKLSVPCRVRVCFLFGPYACFFSLPGRGKWSHPLHGSAICCHLFLALACSPWAPRGVIMLLSNSVSPLSCSSVPKISDPCLTHKAICSAPPKPT